LKGLILTGISVATFARVLYIVDYATCSTSQTAGGDPVGNIAFPLSPTSAGGGGIGHSIHIYIFSLGLILTGVSD
jgi:hypothetical protein